MVFKIKKRVGVPTLKKLKSAATIIVAKVKTAIITAAAEKDNKNNNPRTIIAVTAVATVA